MLNGCKVTRSDDWLNCERCGRYWSADSEGGACRAELVEWVLFYCPLLYLSATAAGLVLGALGAAGVFLSLWLVAAIDMSKRGSV